MHDSPRMPTTDTASVDGGGVTFAGEGADSGGLRRGTEVGRFVVLGELGAGGMGVVYAAYDPELDRKVALKFLRSEHGSPAARARQLREAQALARLNHPHVVAIHDVGALGDRVWLALEFVEGRTLGAWLAERRWWWREVLEVMLQAGRGLQAAHAAGLVHRDLKPDNVMVGDDGRVRVMDLGLARLGAGELAAAAETTATQPELRPELAMLATPVTHAGAVMGTPGYMAPEQLFGLEVGPAADVFAFAVTLWEALLGARPYAGRSFAELVASLRAGKIEAPPRGRRVPRWLRRVIERGLAVAPEQRWPSMQEFLAQLSRGQRRAQLRLAGVGLAVAGLVGLGVWVAQRADRAQRQVACAAAGDSIDAVWNAEVRAQVRDGLVATGIGHAPTTAEKLMPWLDRRAEEWRAARTGACEAASLEGRWDADTLDRSVWCLDERRAELATLVEELAVADGEVVQKAVKVAAGLEPAASCLDAGRLARLPAPPETGREGLRAVQRTLARAANLAAAGQQAEAQAAAREARSEAEAFGWPPLIAAADYWIGVALAGSGAYEEGARALEDSYFAALEGEAISVAADAARSLARVLAVELARPVEARSWLRHAGVLVRELEAEPGLRSALVIVGRGIQHVGAGEYVEARGQYERALEIREAILGPDHPEVAAVLVNLGDTHWRRGEYAEAIELFTRALAISEAAFGSEHPELMSNLNGLGLVRRRMGAFAEARVLHTRALQIGERALGRDHISLATTIGSLANVSFDTGAYAEAQGLYERAIAIQEAALGPEHPDLGGLLNNLANVRYEQGAIAEARAPYERALAIWEKALGPEHPSVAITLANLAMVHGKLGDHRQGLALEARALALQEKTFGPEHPSVATTLVNMAHAHVALGAKAEARRLYERALAIEEKAVGPDHPGLEYALVGLAELALEAGEHAAAIEQASRAVAVTASATASADRAAEARFMLARALWAAPDGRGRDRVRARELASAALAGLRGSEGAASELAEVEAWLAAHRVAP